MAITQIKGGQIKDGTVTSAKLETQGGVSAGSFTTVDITVNSQGVITAIANGTVSNSLNALTDVTLTTLTNGEVLVSSAGTFINQTFTEAGIQAKDATLDSLAALGSVAIDQFIVGTGAGTFAFESGAIVRSSLGLGSIATQAASSVAITGGSITGITDIAITDGGTGASTAAGARTNLGLTIGTNVQAFDSTLTDIAGLGTVAAGEIMVGTGAGTFAFESGNIARTSLGLGTGDSPTFTNVTVVAAPTAGSDLANKSYVDNLSAGLDPKESVLVATSGTLTATAGNGTYVAAGTGLGKTLTAGTAGTTTIDGVLLADGDRVLIKDEVGSIDNGIYTVSASAVGTATIFTRALDQDGTPANEVSGGNFTFVEQGTANGGQGFVVIAAGTIVIDVGAIIWSQFSGAASLIAGNGLIQTANTFNVVGTAGRITANANDIDISASYVGQSSITTLGTITTGTWNGANVAVANGGTGSSTAGGARTNLGLVLGTDIQAFDAGLLSIAGLTTAADTMIYTTASDVYATTALTATARTLLADSTTGAMRTTLGLVIGTDVQAFDADLSAIAALTQTEGNVIKSIGGVWTSAAEDCNATNIVVTGNTTIADPAHCGANIFVDSVSPVTITVPGTLPIDFQFTVIREGSGTVTITSTDLINSSAADIVVADQFGFVYLTQRILGEWNATGNLTPDAGAIILTDLTDVTITAPATGEVLAYTSGVLVENRTLVEAGIQALDAGLTSISGLTTTADTMIYTTALDTYATTAITAFGRSLVADATAATARTTLGLGSLAVQNTITTADIDALAVTEAKLSAAVVAKLNNSANNKYDAIVDPDAQNDSAGTDATAIGTDGSAIFEVGSTWVNTLTNEAFRCVDSTANAAIWINTTLETGELGSMALQDSAAVAITGGTITGITDITVADGGTGASTATAGFDNLAPGTLKGDLIVFDGTNHIRLAVGTNGQVLIADSAQASGIKWGADINTGLVAANFVTREAPGGLVNGVNTTYTLANTPLVGSEEVFLNGLLQEEGIGNDYTISGLTITYLAAPTTGDLVKVNYRK